MCFFLKKKAFFIAFFMDFFMDYILRQSDVFCWGKNGAPAAKWRWTSYGDMTSKATSGSPTPRTGGQPVVFRCVFFYKHLLNQLENQVYLRIPTSLKQNSFFFLKVSGWDCRPSIQWHILKMCFDAWEPTVTFYAEVSQDRFSHQSHNPGASGLASCKARTFGSATGEPWITALLTLRHGVKMLDVFTCSRAM